MKEIKTKANVVQREMLDKTILLNLDNGEYYSLNPTGAAIWNLLSQGASSHKVVAQIASDFSMNSETIKEDVADIIQEFKKAGLLS